MRTRRIISIFAALVLTFGCTAIWSAQGDEQEGDVSTNVVAANDADAGAQVSKPKKKGNRFARFLKAPFKAVGKVFKGGDDEKKIARITEEDAQKFESVGVARVDYESEGGGERASASAAEHLARGRAYLESGNLQAAVTELSRASALEPKLTEANSLLAVAFDRLGMHERARAAHKRTVELDEEDPQALNNLGYSLYLSGNYRAAVDKLKKAVKRAPADARILNNLALAQARLGKYDDAYKNFARAGGDFNGRMNVASLLERAGRDEEAAEHLEKARRLQPASATVLRRLADVYERTGKRAEAQTARQSLEAIETGGALVAGGR